MQTITLSALLHKDQQRIGLHFLRDNLLNALIRGIEGIRWSQSNRCWHLPFTRQAYDSLQQKINGHASINDQALRKRSVAAKTETAPVNFAVKNKRISQANQAQLKAFEDQLKLKAYSPSTIRTYKNELLPLMQLLKDKCIKDLDTQQVKRYLLHCIEKQKLKENTVHSRLNALKFYFEQVLGRQKFFIDIPRPKKPLLLPKVLSEDELGRLFKALSNKKHKAMLFTAYSAGLRVSEIAALKLNNIDSGRMQILVQAAKGKKDRYVNLSPVLLDILRDYIKTCQPRPTTYLFESGQTGEAYPVRTIQMIFGTAKQKAGISKQVGIHSLRHSFATHLLEKGTDIFYIKDLLGHFNIKTTEVYLHVGKKLLVNIVSPLDDLVRKQGLEW